MSLNSSLKLDMLYQQWHNAYPPYVQYHHTKIPCCIEPNARLRSATSVHFMCKKRSQSKTILHSQSKLNSTTKYNF